MYYFVKLLFEICFFKKGPQDIPYSRWLFRALAIVYAGVRFLTLGLHPNWRQGLLQIGVELGLIIGFSWLILYMTGKLNRFLQTASALLGTDALINFVALPGIMTMELGRGGLFLFLLMLILIGWQCAVVTHIVHHAVDQNLPFSFGLAFLYLLLTYQIIAFLFPGLAATS